MSEHKNITEAEVVASLAAAGVVPQTIEIAGQPIVFHAKNVEMTKLSELAQRPAFITHTEELQDLSSFITYYNKHSSDNSVIRVDIESKKAGAVFDDHDDQTQITHPDTEETKPRARHRRHKATYNFPLTVQAKRWIENNGKAMSQVEFAEFLIDSAGEISTPTSAEMIQIARTFQAKTDVSFKQGVNLNNGSIGLTFQETTAAAAGTNGEIKIPEKIVIALQIFRGDEVAYRIEADFRYRTSGGSLTLSYKLIRFEDALETAIKEIASKIDAEKRAGTLLFAKVQ